MATRVLSLIGALTVRLFPVGGSFARAADSQHPNILFILVDDMGWHEPGCWNGTTGRREVGGHSLLSSARSTVSP